MIDSVTLAPKGDVYSIQRKTIVHHTSRGAEVVYKTTDLLQTVWVSPTGTIHAAGRRYHTNRSGAFKASALSTTTSQGLWGVDDDRLFAGGDHGLCESRGGVWRPVSDVPKGAYYSISGTGPSDIYAWDSREDRLLHHNGKAWTRADLPEDLCGVVAIACVTADEVLLLSLFDGNSVVYIGNARAGFRELGRLGHGDCGGVGRGRGGVYLHGGKQLYRDFEEIADVDERVLEQRGQWSLAMTSNGSRVVAAGASTILVDDGDGFVAWPALTAGGGGARRRRQAP